MSFFKSVYHTLIDSPPAQLAATAIARSRPPPHVALTHYEVVVPGLPPGLEGLRVLQVSDLHLRPGSELAWQLPEVAAAAPHDLAVYTGDFIDDDDGIAPVGTLPARMPRVAGAYAVLGNHDHRPRGRAHGRNDVGRLQAALAAAGLEVLTNTARPICGGELVLAGVDDPATGRDDLSRAMRGVPPGVCCLLLAHSPDIVLRLGPYRPGLILAGHTHGGQIRLPLIGPVITMSKVPRPLTMGLHEYAGVPTFVTRGIGYRVFTPPRGSPAEVALLTLRSPPAAARAASAPSTLAF